MVERMADVRGAVAAHVPGYRIDRVACLGEGTDNVAYKVAGSSGRQLIVRFAKEPDPVALDREARLLTFVAGVSPLAVPEPVFVDAERGCLAYAKLPGVPLLDLPRAHRSAHAASIAATLGTFLGALHAVALDRVTDLVGLDNDPLMRWRREADQLYRGVAGQVPETYRPAVEAFLAAPPPPDGYAPVFSHNDLGIEHVLVDPMAWTVIGVIDWSDAAIVDPAYDLGLIHRDQGPPATRAALRAYRAAQPSADLAALERRAVFYARCAVFEDLAYGLETGRHPYLDKSLAALTWLFP